MELIQVLIFIILINPLVDIFYIIWPLIWIYIEIDSYLT